MAHIRHVVCGVSGGVDSAVAAFILKRHGFHVTGLFMKNWDVRDERGECSGEQDREDAQYVCSQLGIPFREVNFVKEYWTDVFSKLVSEYQAGLTPNPDILCNKHVKFGPFVQHAVKVLGADAIATGHYARNSAGRFLQHLNNSEGAKLLTSVDTKKDQTLFLSQIPQSGLQKTMFPVGGLLKSDVKVMAQEIGLERIVRKRESMGICFIGKRDFQDFLEEYLEPNPGDFVDIETGRVVGQHKGVQYWTIGQRVHIGGLPRAYYVAARNAQTQQILVAMGADHPALYFSQMYTETPCWIHQPPCDLQPGGPAVRLKLRYQHIGPITECTVHQGDDGHLSVSLVKPQKAVAAGQYAVFYDRLECLGSAKILKSSSLFDLNITEPIRSGEVVT